MNGIVVPQGRRSVGDIVEINRRNRTVLAEIISVGRVGYTVRTLDEAGQTLHRQRHETFDAGLEWWPGDA